MTFVKFISSKLLRYIYIRNTIHHFLFLEFSKMWKSSLRETSKVAMQMFCIHPMLAIFSLNFLS